MVAPKLQVLASDGPEVWVPIGQYWDPEAPTELGFKCSKQDMRHLYQGPLPSPSHPKIPFALRFLLKIQRVFSDPPESRGQQPAPFVIWGLWVSLNLRCHRELGVRKGDCGEDWRSLAFLKNLIHSSFSKWMPMLPAALIFFSFFLCKEWVKGKLSLQIYPS